MVAGDSQDWNIFCPKSVSVRGCYGRTEWPLTSVSECFSVQMRYGTKNLLMLLKTCLVVSKNEVPARIQRCIGSTGMKEIAGEKKNLIHTFHGEREFPVEEQNVSRLGLYKHRVTKAIKNGRKSVLHINRSQVSFPIMTESSEEMRPWNYLKTSILSGNRQMYRTT